MILATLFAGADLATMLASVLSFIGVIYTAWISLKTKKDTDEINKSVNHIQPGEARLYELALKTAMHVGQLVERLGTVEKKLDDHIATDKCPLAEKCSEIISEFS